MDSSSVTGCYHRWRLTATSIEMPFAVSQCGGKTRRKVPFKWKPLEERWRRMTGEKEKGGRVKKKKEKVRWCESRSAATHHREKGKSERLICELMPCWSAGGCVILIQSMSVRRRPGDFTPGARSARVRCEGSWRGWGRVARLHTSRSKWLLLLPLHSWDSLRRGGNPESAGSVWRS